MIRVVHLIKHQSTVTNNAQLLLWNFYKNENFLMPIWFLPTIQNYCNSLTSLSGGTVSKAFRKSKYAKLAQLPLPSYLQSIRSLSSTSETNSINWILLHSFDNLKLNILIQCARSLCSVSNHPFKYLVSLLEVTWLYFKCWIWLFC